MVLPQVRVWDVRRSGCVAVVDQHDAEAHPATVAMPPLNDRCLPPQTAACQNQAPRTARFRARLSKSHDNC